ncbi:uncharacterized protein LOC126733316 [Quercus robur]|uniref:uncharacterized protein LOC126733316 n=1 Tax=Quercus robur TaxID=38942 RepID=UPI002162CAE2|nr:uncharacterized protein LOC126733316 [Quercus robur]
MTTKFNQELYTYINAKKNEPFSSIGQRRVRVVKKEKEKEVTKKGSSTPTSEEGQAASLVVSIEEIIPPLKKCQMGDKGKDKMGASVWVDTGMTLAYGEPSCAEAHPGVRETMHITSQYLLNEEKAVVANSKVEVLEAKGSHLRRDLIAAMDDNNASKEKLKALSEMLNAEKLLVKQKVEQLVAANLKMKNAMTKAIHAFQLTDE